MFDHLKSCPRQWSNLVNGEAITGYDEVLGYDEEGEQKTNTGPVDTVRHAMEITNKILREPHSLDGMDCAMMVASHGHLVLPYVRQDFQFMLKGNE